jgi:hypothetical protein
VSCAWTHPQQHGTAGTCSSSRSRGQQWQQQQQQKVSALDGLLPTPHRAR